MKLHAGELLAVPGAPLPGNLRSSRANWAPLVARGCAATALPGLMAGLYSLCGHAHRLCSQLAIHTAAPDLFADLQTLPALLQRETALEHLRRMGLDWPRALPEGTARSRITRQAGASLQRCPLVRAQAGAAPDRALWRAMRHWLRDDLLQMEPADWLRAWQTAGSDGLRPWLQARSGAAASDSQLWLAPLLSQLQADDTPLPLPSEDALQAHAHAADLQALGAALAADEGLALQPLWRGRPAHTGPWSRLNLHAWAPPDQPRSAWSLLALRVAELVRLCGEDEPGQSGAGWLSWGAVSTGPRSALAWVEMSRGLLLHQVQLADADAGAGCSVLHGQMLAPTEWNFHPAGVAAQLLAGLEIDAPQTTAKVRLAMLALDPCVPVKLATSAQAPRPVELSHA